MAWLLTSHTVAQLLIWLGGYLIPCKLKIRSRSEELNQEELKKHKGASTTHFHCWSHSSPTSWQPSNHDLVLLVTSSHPEILQRPIKSGLIRTKDASVTQEIPRNIGSLCQDPGLKIKYQNKRCFCYHYHPQNYKGFRSCVQGSLSKDQMYVFSFISLSSFLIFNYRNIILLPPSPITHMCGWKIRILSHCGA